MIRRLIRWSSDNPLLVLALAVFVALLGAVSMRTLPLDAMPDLSDTQVIVYTEYPGQSPHVVEDQVTYPLSTALLSVPRSRVVRGMSYFGVSFVYIVFNDGVDIYWARTRVMEALSGAQRLLPDRVRPVLGPDASGLGWVYQYAIVGEQHSLGDLRSIQDWQARLAVAKADGVAEVASVGGFVKQYTIVVDPRRLQSLGIPLGAVREAIRASNQDVGGRTLEMAETEFMVRGRGLVRGLGDLESIVIRSTGGVPVLVRDVARVEVASEERRGVAELDGRGEIVSGIAIQRHGVNALSVIENVKSALARVAASLPAGVELRTLYDRSELIQGAIATLRGILLEEAAVVAVVCLIFLMHVRSALIAVVVLPVGVLATFLAMRWLGVSSSIMSLGGIAIAIGAMVDAAIVMLENAHKHLERAPSGASRHRVLLAAAVEVGPALALSLSVITVSFLPIMALQAEEGRLFQPLALTKSVAMAVAALLSVTLVPALMAMLLRGPIAPERANPLNRVLLSLYRLLLATVFRRRGPMLAMALLVLIASFWPLSRMGAEFMPPLDEGTLLFMPTTQPSLSMAKASEILQRQNRIIASFPEVAQVAGKAGRAATATDSAPTEMFETIIVLKPHRHWRSGITREKLVEEMDAALQFPGIVNVWTMPIRARIDMLSTGIRTPLGLKILGPDIVTIERVARELESIVRRVPGARSVFAERILSGSYIDILPDRERLARYGLTVSDVQQVVTSAIGADPITTAIEGRARFTIALRFPRDMRSDPDAISREALVSLPNGGAVPLGEVATVSLRPGPAVIRTENAEPAAYVLVDIRDRDLAGFVTEAQREIATYIRLPAGHSIIWSGQYEHYERAGQRLAIVAAATVAIITLLLFAYFRRALDVAIVMLTLPFAFVGGVWLTWWFGYALSVAVAVGFLALAGVAAQTGILMLLYIREALTRAHKQASERGRTVDEAGLAAAITEGAVDRLRPKVMTVAAIVAGLSPIMWSDGPGADVIRRIAVPVLGGMATSAILTLLVIPVVMVIAEGRRSSRRRVSLATSASTAGAGATPLSVLSAKR